MPTITVLWQCITEQLVNHSATVSPIYYFYSFSVGSSISRDSMCGCHINAGPEIGVASTKVECNMAN